MSQQIESASTMQERSASKRLVKILVLIGIGIPVLIEAATLVRLIGGHLGDEEQNRSAAADAAAHVVVEEGDELLPATAPAETIVRMVVRARPDAWTFLVEAEVANPTEHPYELTLRALETQHGEVLDEAHVARRAPGDSARLSARWRLPAGDLPASMEVEGRLVGAPDSVQAAPRRVHFDRIPVRMRE